MSKKYKDTQREYNLFFHTAASKFYTKKYGTPKPLNRDFLNSIEKDYTKTRKGKKLIPLVLAILLICLFSIGTFLFESNETYADKGILHRIYKSILGIDMDEQDNNSERKSISVEITSMDDIKEARDLCENLYIPKYMPTGYKLKRLIVEKFSDTEISAKYTFENLGKKVFDVTLTYVTSSTISYGTNNDCQIIKLNDRTLFAYTDQEGVACLTEECMIIISGDISQNEMIKVAKYLQK